MNLRGPYLNHEPSCYKSRSVRSGGALNVTSAHVYELTIATLLLQGAAIIGSAVRHWMEMNWSGKGREPMVDNNYRSAHSSGRDDIT